MSDQDGQFEIKLAPVTFEGSSARSHRAPRFDLIPFVVLERLAARYGIGAAKYGDKNWQSGGPAFRDQCAMHLIEHLWAWMEDRPDPDGGTVSAHLDAVLWNAAALVWFEEQAKKTSSKDSHAHLDTKS